MDRNENGELQLPDEQELNLLYVAVTRGRKWVQLNHDLAEFVEKEFPRHFEELRPSRVLERTKERETVEALDRGLKSDTMNGNDELQSLSFTVG
jgi:hypothetical protein